MENARPASSMVNRDHLECVQSQLNFARRTSDEKAPEVVLPGFDMASSSGAPPMHVVLPPMVGYNVTIRNARPIVDELSLDREGFTLIQHKISCANEGDPRTLCHRYLEDMVPFIKNYFNASWVVPRRQAVIVRSTSGRSIPEGCKPGLLAHIDYAPISGPITAAIEDQLQGIPSRVYSRLIIVQTWHALSPPPQDFPLAFCDCASVDDTDSVVVDYTFRGTKLKFCVMRFNPAQRWYYFPEMTADELILFKGYDSEAHCNAMAPHSAFDNRRAYPSAKPRESIEARFCVYYD